MVLRLARAPCLVAVSVGLPRTLVAFILAGVVAAASHAVLIILDTRSTNNWIRLIKEV